MIPILKSLGDRLKVLLLTDAALDIEATLLSRQADRVATLLIEADQHDEHGCPVVTTELRRQAEALSLERPLASIRPAIHHLQDHHPDRDFDLEPSPIPTTTTTNGNGNGNGNGHGHGHGHGKRRTARLPGTSAGRTV